MRCILLVVAFGLLSGVSSQNYNWPYLIVNTTTVLTRGFQRTAINDGVFHSFRRIPYAVPPIGNRRFMDPVPLTGWSNASIGFDDLPHCVQESQNANINYIGVEDCLYLNVHTRHVAYQIPANDNNGTLLPVMVWIHGGFFKTGSGREDLFNPRFLMTQDIVLVTFNYRLNIFGFFSVEDHRLNAQGNVGLKDQVMALRWVRENIRNFGGNPQRVTIFGNGAGAASVHYHMLSPLSTGLFHRAILQSGTALSPWTHSSRNNGINLAHLLNINVTNTRNMLGTLQRLTADHIFDGYRKLEAASTLTVGSMVNPVIDGVDRTSFLREDPLDLIRNRAYNSVPMMIGYADSEGIEFHTRPIGNITDMIPPDLDITRDRTLRALGEEIEAFYFSSAQTNRTGMIKIYTDAWFAFPAFRTATLHVQNTTQDILFYRFSADTRLNVFKREAGHATIPGASHQDQIAYLFYTDYSNATNDLGEIERTAIDRLMTLWANFAHGRAVSHQSPQFTWRPITPPTDHVEAVFNFAEIGSNDTTMMLNPDQVRMAFWDDIYRRYGSGASISRGFMVLVFGFNLINLLIK